MDPQIRQRYETMKRIHEDCRKAGANRDEFVRRVEKEFRGEHSYMEALIYVSLAKDKAARN